MSEEFYMQVSVELESEQHQQDIEILIEHLELYEKEEVTSLITTYQPEAMTENFDSAVTPYSDYVLGDDVIEMYLQCYDESIDDMEVSLTENPIGMNITLEGKDNNAADFGSALLLLLKGMSGSNIQAKAATDYWQALWCENSDCILTVTLEEYEQ